MLPQTKNSRRGIVYLRRSSERQEESLHQQLNWAIRRAEEGKIELRVTVADLEYAIEHNLVSHGDLYLDRFQGADLHRPGLMAFHARATKEGNEITDCLFYARDRFARPEMAEQAVNLEKQILMAGKRTITSTFCCDARGRYANTMGQDLQLMVEYGIAGQFRPELAKRVLRAHSANAQRGFACGGRACYGFARYSVREGSTELTRLPDRETRRGPGLKVVVLPGNDAKSLRELEVVKRIHQVYFTGRSGLRGIASQLNIEGIPSPDHGRLRKGVLVPGEWTTSAVRGILTQPLYMGAYAWGRRAEGNTMRFDATSSESARVVTNSEIRTDRRHGRIKVFRERERWTMAETPEFTIPQTVPPHVWIANFSKLEVRRQQKGANTPHCPDPSKYPLSVYCMSCGRRMTGLQLKNRDGNPEEPMYACSTYHISGAKKCARNRVSRDVAVWGALEALCKIVNEPERRRELGAAIRQRLELARQPIPTGGGREGLERKLQELVRQKDIAYADKVRASEDDLREDAAKFYDLKVKEVRALRSQIAATTATEPSTSIDEEVARTIAILDKMDLFLKKVPEGSLRAVFDALGMRLDVTFENCLRGKRRFSQPTAGVFRMTLEGGRDTPINELTLPRGREGELRMSNRGDRI